MPPKGPPPVVAPSYIAPKRGLKRTLESNMRGNWNGIKPISNTGVVQRNTPIVTMPKEDIDQKNFKPKEIKKPIKHGGRVKIEERFKASVVIAVATSMSMGYWLVI